MSVELFDFDEKGAARILRVHPDTLKKWRRAGLIGHHKMPGGRIRYTTEQLTDFKKATLVLTSAPR